MRFYSKQLLYTQGEKSSLAGWKYFDVNNQIILYNYFSINTSVTVPRGRTFINDYYNAASIGYAPFYNNKNIVNVDCQKVPFINNSAKLAFANSTNLVRVTNLSSRISDITSAFSNCYSLEYVDVLPEVSSLSGTFRNCYNLVETPLIPNTVIRADYSFSNCNSINNMANLANNTVLQNMAYMYQGTNLTGIDKEIPNTATNLSGTFANCYNMSYVSATIPSNVTEINNLFTNCVNLSGDIYIQCSNINQAWNFANGSDMYQKNVFIPYKYLNGYNTKTYNTFQTAGYLSGINNVIIKDYLEGWQYTSNETTWILQKYTGNSANINIQTMIAESPCVLNGYYTFANNPNVTNVNFNNIPVLGGLFDSTFNNCSNLGSVTIPSSVTNMINTFQNCVNFNQSVEIPSSVINMSRTFANCVNFNQSIIIPSKLSYAYYTFDSCANFNKSVTIQANTNDATLYALFNNCYSFNQPLSIPDGVNIAVNILQNCNSFNQPVTFGNTVKYLDDFFYQCEKFNQPTIIPNSVISINSMFYRCINYNQPTLLGSNIYFMTNTFSSCINFNQQIEIPESVRGLSYTFYHCINYNQPTNIPNKVIYMNGTFRNCYQYNQPINIPDSVTNMAWAFYWCNTFNHSVNIPSNVTSLYSTFVNCSNLAQNIRIISPNIINALNCFARTSSRKNVFIPYTYDNGVLTATYNSFKAAGYIDSLGDGDTLANGVYMYNIANYT